MIKKIKSLGVGGKLTAVFVVILILSLGAAGIFIYREANEDFHREAGMRLRAIRGLKAERIEQYFANLVNDVEIIANLPMAEQGLPLFTEAFQTGLNSGDYQEAEDQYRDDFEDYQERLGLYDLFLIDRNGNVVFSAEQEGDLGTNLEQGRYSNSGLAQAYRGGRERTILTDFEIYEVHGSPASFVAAPVRNGETGELLGVVAFEVPINEINDIMQEETGMGRTGETYIVGDDYFMRSDSRYGAILRQEVRMDSVEEALVGNEGIVTAEDYRGELVMSAYTPLDIPGQNWVMIADVDEDEVMEPVYNLRNDILIIGVIALIISVAVGLFSIRKIVTQPIEKVNEVLDYVSDRNFANKVKYSSQDELGKMADNLNETIRKLSQALNQVRQAAVNVSNSSTEIAEGNQDLSQRTQEQSSSLEEVSATIEEINSSIREVANNSEEADDLSDQTMDAVNKGAEVVEDTMDSMEKITESSKEISEIITTVNDIAFQTNLLALNAAVEAARAGEHGKGFAVVAAEVRNLASQAADSAEEIEELITTIINQIEEGNELVGETKEALEEIIENSRNTSQAVSEIAAAMEEQSSATNQMQGAVEELDQTTQQNASMVEEIASASESLNGEAEELSDVVRKFKLSEEDTKGQIKKNLSLNNKKSKKQNQKSEEDSIQGVKDLEASMGEDFDEGDFEKF